MVALLMTTWYFMSFLCAPILGSLSDHVGRRPVILISLFGSGLDFFAQALSPTLRWLFITRAINGVSGASMTVANAYIADITPPAKRAGAYGMIGAAFGLGFVIGPLIGGTLGAVDIRLPFFVAGGLTLVNWLYGLFVLPESLPPNLRRPFEWKRANPVGAFRGLGRYPLVRGLAASIFLVNLAQFGLHATWVLYTSHRYGWTPRDVGLSLALVGIGAAVIQGGLARKIIPALGPGILGEKRALIIGLALGSCAYLAYGLATRGWMIYAIIAVASLGAIGQPAIQAIISKTVRPDEQGEVQGTLTALVSVAGIFGPIIGGTAFGYFVSDRAPAHIPGAPFFLSAIMSALGLLVAAWAVRNVKDEPDHGAKTGEAASGGVH
jgi:DHA1 family tetracycline resistance protein-like MFS transporter